MRRIAIEVEGKGRALMELDRRNVKTADAVYDILPIRARASVWLDEIYFAIPLELEDENPSPASSRDDISYWSPGPAFCIFLGNSQPYSPVNHIGRLTEGRDLLLNVQEGDWISLSIAE
ncbi:MAG: hypothetical protein GKC10_03210 [Methanosarcinales archaeon]|nr:hypothetical protein [Methanosarcinales archaeon]